MIYSTQTLTAIIRGLAYTTASAGATYEFVEGYMAAAVSLAIATGAEAVDDLRRLGERQLKAISQANEPVAALPMDSAGV